METSFILGFRKNKLGWTSKLKIIINKNESIKFFGKGERSQLFDCCFNDPNFVNHPIKLLSCYPLLS